MDPSGAILERRTHRVIGQQAPADARFCFKDNNLRALVDKHSCRTQSGDSGADDDDLGPFECLGCGQSHRWQRETAGRRQGEFEKTPSVNVMSLHLRHLTCPLRASGLRILKITEQQDNRQNQRDCTTPLLWLLSVALRLISKALRNAGHVAFSAHNTGEFMSMEHCRVSFERYRPSRGDTMVITASR